VFRGKFEKNKLIEKYEWKIMFKKPINLFYFNS